MTAISNPQRLLVLLAAMQAFGPLSIDMYLPGLPLIAGELGSSANHAQLTITSFLVGLFIGMLFYGPLSDKYGRRQLLLGGIVVYVIASLGCVLVKDADQLVLARFIQALGGAAASVLGRAIVRDLFPINEAARILSLMHLVTMIATLVAPLVGSLIIATLGWRALFLALMLYAATVLMFTLWKVPETHTSPSRELSLPAVFGGYLQLLREPVAVGYILCMSLTFAGMFAYITASPFVYIEFFGVTPEQYAWLFSLNIGAIILFVTVNARIVGSTGTQRMLTIAASTAAVSALLLLLGGWFSAGGLTLIVIALFGFVGVTGVMGANCMASLLGHYPKQAGTVAGLAIATQFGLGALASSLTSVFNDGTPLPMTMITGFCGLGAYGALVMALQALKTVGEEKQNTAQQS
ncbi:Bcr/CflA family multidrug efflux MFS transporter [Endozoicomonadaceae bacterium StTr2]